MLLDPVYSALLPTVLCVPEPLKPEEENQQMITVIKVTVVS